MDLSFPDAERIFDKFQEYTMIPKQRYLENINLAYQLKFDKKFPFGAIVECGVWRGGMIAGFLEIFGPSRYYMLFDSFQGLPEPNSNDGEDALWWKAHPEHPRYFNNCYACQLDAQNLLSEKLSNSNLMISKGFFENTLHKTSISAIAFLHLDCDWYDSNLICLQRCWNHLLPGGAIIIDDYFDWEGCRRAVHDFLSSVRAREAIERVGKTGGAFIRKLGPWEITESPHLL